MKSNVSYVGAWLVAASLAFAMAVATPDESSVMGRLPAFSGHAPFQQPTSVAQGLPSDRTLALITFKKTQRAQIESWIEGLNLRNDSSIAWLRMPVLNDPGTSSGRSEAESRLIKHYPAEAESAKLVPVFTDREQFVRSAGLSSTEQASAVVINRKGEVLARVEGQFDPDKAQSLRQTLRGAENF